MIAVEKIVFKCIIISLLAYNLVALPTESPWAPSVVVKLSPHRPVNVTTKKFEIELVEKPSVESFEKKKDDLILHGVVEEKGDRQSKVNDEFRIQQENRTQQFRTEQNTRLQDFNFQQKQLQENFQKMLANFWNQLDSEMQKQAHEFNRHLFNYKKRFESLMEQQDAVYDTRHEYARIPFEIRVNNFD